MLVLEDLAQLAAFADCGTLTRAAESLHISQPTITRTMQHLEEEFGVSLFLRGKNRITFNETGQKAVEQARKLLRDAREAVEQVWAFDQRLHTIAVQSCAPAPLWTLLPVLSREFPERTISSALSEESQIVQGVASGSCQIGVLSHRAEAEGLNCVPFLSEQLFVCIPNNHGLAGYTQVDWETLNGYNCLLRSQIGFWDKLCRREMPASRFLVQTDEFEFRELIRQSTLLCFTSNLAEDPGELLEHRTVVPITSPSAQATYHLLFTDPVYRIVAETCRTRG